MSGGPEQLSPTLKLAGGRRRFHRISSHSQTCLRLVAAWLAIDCLCSSQSPAALLQSSGKGVLKNQAGRQLVGGGTCT